MINEKYYGILFKNDLTNKGLALYKIESVANKQLEKKRVDDSQLDLVLIHIVEDEIEKGYANNILINIEKGVEKRIDYIILNNTSTLDITD